MSAAEEEFFANLFRTYFRPLRDQILRVVSARDVAEELTQEAFARMYAARATAVESPRGFLFRTARNLALDHLRRRRVVAFDRLEAGAYEQIEDNSPSAERWLAAREELELLRTVILELPPKCRQVFLLLSVEGRSFKEIAAEMGLSDRMVRNYAARAIEHCQRRLGRIGP